MPHGEDRRNMMMELEKICYKNSKYRGVIKFDFSLTQHKQLNLIN